MKKFLESPWRKPVMWFVALASFAVFCLLCVQIGKEVFPLFDAPTPTKEIQTLVVLGGLVAFAFLWVSFASIVVAQKGKLRREKSTSKDDMSLREAVGLVFFATFVFFIPFALGWVDLAEPDDPRSWSWAMARSFIGVLSFFSLLFLPGCLGCDLRGGPRARRGTPGRHGYSIPALRGRFWVDTDGPHRDCQCAECLETFHGVPQE